MKKQFFFLFALIVLLAACNNSAEKNEAITTEKTETEKSDNASTASNTSASDGQARIEELKKLPPISNETLKSIFPAEAMGMKRTSFSVNSAMGYAMGNAEYKKEDTVHYSVGIYDCAGEAGSAFYGISYLSKLNMEREDDNGYEKTVSYKGTNAIEAYDKYSNEHRMHFLAGERFWVTVEGNEGIDKLKSFVESLGLDKLKGLK
jgi:hypothetical protein